MNAKANHVAAFAIVRSLLGPLGLLARARRHRAVRVPTLRRLLQVSKHTHSKYIAVPAYLLCIVYCRLDTNLLSRGKPAVLKLATAAFGANASWVTIATALQIQVNLRQVLLTPQP